MTILPNCMASGLRLLFSWFSIFLLHTQLPLSEGQLTLANVEINLLGFHFDRYIEFLKL